MSDIASHIASVAKFYWGDPNNKLSGPSELRFGTNGSKSVDLEKGCWFDHENHLGGGVVDLVRQEERLDKDEPVWHVLNDKLGIKLTPQNLPSVFSKTPISYGYYDAQGALSYAVQRHVPKRFKQCKPDGSGGWIYNLEGVEPVPYGLPEIINRPTELIYIVEGEKCANALEDLGVLATTNSGGAGNWKPELNKHFAGRDVVILPDNDDAGKTHARKVVDQLLGTAASIKVVDLPGLDNKGDVFDWFAAGKTPEELKLLVDNSEVIKDPLPNVKQKTPKDVFLTLSIDQLFALPEPKLLIDDMITENSFSIIYGAPGAGKSFVALDMGLSIAAGMPWQNKPVKQGSVLYIAGEGDGGLKRRVQAFEIFHALSSHPPFSVLPMAVNFHDELSVEKLFRTIDNLAGDFSAIFVDTVARALPGCDENSAADMGAFISACDGLRHYTGAAVIGIHHSGKDSSRGMRGSSALLGAVDTSIEVSGSDGLLCLKTEKQKDREPHPPIYLKMKPFEVENGSSIVLELIETGLNGKPPKRQKFGSSRNYAAFQALRNLLIDQGATKIPVNRWHEAHAGKSPDLTATKRKDARQALQDKELVVVNAGMVWINRTVEAKVEPFHDAEE